MNLQNVDVKTTVHGKIVPQSKSVQTGGRGGLFYINAAGNRVYLKAYQREKCLKNTLSSDTGACRSGVLYQNDDDGNDDGDDDTSLPVKKKRHDAVKRAYGGFIAK